MSVVTNLILTFSLSEDTVIKEKEINLFFNNGRDFKIVSVDCDETKIVYGGSKCFETNLYLGAYNHLDLPELIKHIKDIDWVERENVQLIIKEEQDEKFKIIELT